MTFSEFFYGLGDLFTWMLEALQGDMIGNHFNTVLLFLGFIGFGIWMNKQRKFNNEAKNNPNQLK